MGVSIFFGGKCAGGGGWFEGACMEEKNQISLLRILGLTGRDTSTKATAKHKKTKLRISFSIAT